MVLYGCVKVKGEYYGSGQYEFNWVKTDVNSPIKIMDNVKLPNKSNTNTTKDYQEKIDYTKETYNFDNLKVGDKFGNG